MVRLQRYTFFCLVQRNGPVEVSGLFISKIRVRVEHAIGSVKFMMIVKDECRLRANQFVERIFAICAALHNLRITTEPWIYKI